MRNNDATDVQFVHIIALLLAARIRKDRRDAGWLRGSAQLPAGDHSPFSLQILQSTRPPVVSAVSVRVAQRKP